MRRDIRQARVELAAALFVADTKTSTIVATSQGERNLLFFLTWPINDCRLQSNVSGPIAADCFKVALIVVIMAMVRQQGPWKRSNWRGTD